MRFTAWAVVLVLVCFASISSAGVLSATADNDGDGAIIMKSWNWNGTSSVLTMNEILKWAPAHAIANFVADGDPTVTFWKDVQNDTTFAWTDYHINIIRMQNDPFTIIDALSPTGWDLPQITQPTLMPSYLIDGNPFTNVWVGSVDYYAGTGSPIAIGASGVFNAKVSFLNSANFCLEQIPTPEPGSLSLLVIGSMAMLRRRAA
jgi:hypothetical protein